MEGVIAIALRQVGRGSPLHIEPAAEMPAIEWVLAAIQLERRLFGVKVCADLFGGGYGGIEVPAITISTRIRRAQRGIHVHRRKERKSPRPIHHNAVVPVVENRN